MKVVSGKTAVVFYINGQRVDAVVTPSDTLLDVMRNGFGLTGCKPGCENGDCGACTVLMDGWPMKACLVLAVEAQGHEITTIEGLKNTPIQDAFIRHNAFQCGYCTPGFILVCHALLSRFPDADDYTIETWLQSNICRCTSYQEISDAVREAAQQYRALG